TTVITWTVTDIYGNTNTSTQSITVTDNEKPTISIVNISVVNDLGQCAATVNLGIPVTRDNCGIASVVNDHPSAVYPVGTTVVNWTVTDTHGNRNYITQTVVVTDSEKPVITCAANQVFCANTGGNLNYTIPVLQQNDNCGIATTTYAVTGATSRSGTGVNASGVFNIGLSTVTFTVKDIHNNTSTCSYTVRINALPVASITAANADVFCSKFALTGNSTLTGPFTYQWLYANTNFRSTQSINLDLTNGDGVYSLYTTDVNGCKSELAATYTYQKQNLVNSYTILVSKEAEFGKYNKVVAGSVGVMTAKGEAGFKAYSSVSGVGSFVKSPKIDKDGSGIVLTPVIGIATPTLPTMQYNTADTRFLANYNATQNNAILTANYRELTVKKGVSVTVTGTTFGSIRLEEGASIKFTSNVLNIDNLTADKGAKNSDYSYIRLAPNTSVRVSSKVSIGSQVLLNPEANKVTFYMGDLKNDEEKFTVKGGDTRVIANIYMPDGKLRVTATDSENDDHDNCDHKAHSAKDCKHKGHDHNDCNHAAHSASSCNDDVYMTGLFIVEDLESKGNTVIWSNYDCSTPPTVVLNSTSNTITQAAVSENKTAVEVTEEELKVTVMPNPSTTFFTLKLESKYETPVNMRVMDGQGRVVDAKSKIGANSTIQIGHNYSSGTYYAELIQGTKRKVVQLIKGRG
ncbi:MAG: T9SS type A sorting domain-containing protein, partial [Sediminibacterium sp.]